MESPMMRSLPQSIEAEQSVIGAMIIDKSAIAQVFEKLNEDDFERVSGDADTLAGLLLEIKGEFPVLHEKVSYLNYEFEVLEMDNRRILKVKFIINQPQTEEDA